jgi:hypothetical protein
MFRLNLQSCALTGNERKHVLNLRLELVNVGGCGFPTHVMAPGTATSTAAALNKHRIQYVCLKCCKRGIPFRNSIFLALNVFIV